MGLGIPPALLFPNSTPHDYMYSVKARLRPICAFLSRCELPILPTYPVTLHLPFSKVLRDLLETRF